ncbi:MAG: DinB family protein [Dehalococcoidia bacterium]
MTRVSPGRPAPSEHIPYYGQYIRLVPDGDIVEILERQLEATLATAASVTPELARARSAPEAWNAIELAGHLADAERILTYRAFRFARADPAPLAGVDFESYVPAAGFSQRTFADVIEEFASVRQATLTLLRSLDAAAWTRDGLADGQRISVRALAYVLAGHELAHTGDIRDALQRPSESAV